MIFGTTNWLAWIILGGLAGAVAKLITPGRDPGGCLVTVVLGIAGALVAGWLGRALHWYGPNDSAGFLAAIVGAIILLVAYRLISRRR
ncbi:GlsB/YeaQ/YmgE family stress response membrane protein [Sphingomonas ginkgonis]|uniref:GlsB/YeaQ/YmgE family stress response membrane protein n=1 Tax=Sphingomonas ginkgonis TaxID=2315330 RepID=A0A429VDD9_9SPHN|nr:GlsB/YeaQ/YmgE family stress response membrane protein [Sphingomonas ginkgonis]RST31954.1 GlsB/YeaQ/YmgE family stress response membrane protein [Sphingomonas ginkgonis]